MYIRQILKKMKTDHPHKKILFTDLDDTLLDDNKNVAPEDVDTINRMLGVGHRFVIATGRPIYSAKKVAKKLGLYRDGIYIAASNGGVIYDCSREKIIHADTLDIDLVDSMFKAAMAENMHVHTYTDEYVVSMRQTKALEIYSRKISMPYKILDKIPEDLPAPPPKLVIMSIEEGSRRILEDFEKRHAESVKGRAVSVFSNDFLLEYLPVGVSKGRAVVSLCEKLGIPVADSVAVGDEANDIPMIDAAGVGAVMKNGTDEAKSHAGYVTDRTNNECGVSEVIRKFILEG